MTEQFSQLIPLAILSGSVVFSLVGFYVWQKYKRQVFGTAGLVQKRLLTPNEVDFYHRLCRALGPRWTVLAQVSMGALVDTRLKPKHPRYWDERSRFSAKICDFVVCDSRTLVPQLVVELDDVMHDFDKDKVRDSLTSKAGYRTVRFWSRKKPTDGELKEVLSRELALN